MPGNRLAVITDDPALGSALQALLKSNVDQAPFLCGLSNARDHIGRDTDGLLLVAVASVAEADKAFRLIQEISIQQFPVQIVLIEGEALPHGEGRNNLDHHITARLRWPDDSQRLLRLTREPLGKGAGFLGTRTETLEEIISRRLLSHTPSLLALVERIALAAVHQGTVLLTGQTGTGKP